MFLTVCIILIIVGICVGIANNNNKLETQNQLKDKIENYDSLIHFYTLSSTLPALSIDKEKFIIYQYCYDNTFKLSNIKIRNIKDITKCEFLEDSKIIQTTNRGSQIAGAIIGGVAFGPIGALVGGVTGKKTSKKQNISYEIRIYYKIPESPVDVIKLNVEDTALHFYATIDSLINFDKQKEQVTSF